MNIPKRFGGLEVDEKTIAKIKVELSSGWLSLTSLLGSHLRVCAYINKFGTEEQKQKFLPALAKGDLIACHANNERNGKASSEWETTLTINQDNVMTLSGKKDWITNSRDATLFAVTARVVNLNQRKQDLPQSAVILLTRDTEGLSTGNDWQRMGIHGVSLAPVLLKDVQVNAADIIGDFQTEGAIIVASSERVLLLDSTSRSVGAMRRIIEKCLEFITTRERKHVVGQLAQEPSIKLRIGEIMTNYLAAKAYFEKVIEQDESSGMEDIIACKAFCTEQSRKVALAVQQMFGAQGYTSEQDIFRQVNDITSLSIIHAPTDMLFDKLSKMVIKVPESKEQTSTVLRFAHSIPHIPYEHLLKASMNEVDVIRKAQMYKGVELFLFDFTTQSPSNTFKDVMGCVTFATAMWKGIKVFCAQSSGNTASSFIKYAGHTGVKMILFYPRLNSYKIDP